MWLLLSVACMFAAAGWRLVQKPFYTRTKLNPFRANWLTFAVSLPIFGTIALANISAIHHLPEAFWLVLVAVVIGFYPAVNYLLFVVIRQNDLSEVLPLMSLVPIFTLASAWLILGQVPSAVGIIGILLVSVSIYVLRFQSGMGWLEPFQFLLKSGASRGMLAVSIITALAAIGDKFAIDRSSVYIYASLNMIGAVIVLLVSDFYLSYRDKRQTTRTFPEFRKDLPYILAMGILFFAAQIFGFASLKYAPNSGYSVGIRNLQIVFASLLAIWIFRERTNRYKTLSYGLSAIGLVMIAL